MNYTPTQEAVICTSICNLSFANIERNSIKFSCCGMDSDRYITVCDSGLKSPEFVIIDLVTQNSIFRQSSPADAALAHPHLKIVALRYDKTIRLLDLQSRNAIKSGDLPDSVVFWRWVSADTLSIVTKTAVYHWSLEGSSGPLMVFGRSTPIMAENVQIINYQVSPSQQWCLLVGLQFESSREEPSGILQLYSVQKETSQNVAGRNGVFALVTLKEKQTPIEVLCYEHKKANDSAQLIIVQVGKDNPLQHFVSQSPIDLICTTASVSPAAIAHAAPPTAGPYRAPPIGFPLHPGCNGDFPVTMTVSPQHDLLFTITRHGCLHIFDIHTSALLYSKKTIRGSVFVSCLHRDGGLLCITRRCGDVFKITVNYAMLLENYKNRYGESDYIDELAGRLRSTPAFAPSPLLPCSPHAPPFYDTLEAFAHDFRQEIISSSLKTSADPMENTCLVWTNCQCRGCAAAKETNTSNDTTLQGDVDWVGEYPLYADFLSQSNGFWTQFNATLEATTGAATEGNSTCIRSCSIDMTLEWDPSEESQVYSETWESLPSPANTVDSIGGGGVVVEERCRSSEEDNTGGEGGTLCEGLPHMYPYRNEDTNPAHRDTVAAQCNECNAMLNQLAGTLECLDKSQRDLADAQREVDILRGNMDALCSIEDCEAFELQLLASLNMVKSRKASLLQKMREKEREEKLCVICQEREKCVVLIPCGHLCICQECSVTTGLACCPLDRKSIENYLVVYL